MRTKATSKIIAKRKGSSSSSKVEASLTRGPLTQSIKTIEIAVYTYVETAWSKIQMMNTAG